MRVVMEMGLSGPDADAGPAGASTANATAADASTAGAAIVHATRRTREVIGFMTVKHRRRRDRLARRMLARITAARPGVVGRRAWPEIPSPSRLITASAAFA